MPSDTLPSPAPVTAIDARQLVPFDDLVGRQEIAAKLQVTVAAVDTWRRRYGKFPEPVTTLSGTPIWRWSHVAQWARTTPRRPGRPRKDPHA
jgi:hypothetical protein